VEVQELKKDVVFQFYKKYEVEYKNDIGDLPEASEIQVILQDLLFL